MLLFHKLDIFMTYNKKNTVIPDLRLFESVLFHVVYVHILTQSRT